MVREGSLVFVKFHFSINFFCKSQLIWVQAIQADEQQPYQVEVPSEPGRINELKLAILEAEQITLSTSHIYIRISRYGPKLFIGDKLVDIYPHGQSSDNPFWYLLLCPGIVNNAIQ